MRRAEITVVALCLICFSHQRSTPESNSYVAAVLEYQFTRNTSQNLQNYLHYIQQAAEQGADILVFPEMTLTRGVNVKVPIHGLLKEYPIPALYPQYYNEILVTLSSAVRRNAIYTVVNLLEEMDCRDAPGEFCPEEKTYVFNTNVVFDRSGAIIDRYRKINLFGEYTRSPALKPELGVFETDFGVRFGHFICFDLMFQVPATQVVQKHNLTDIIFSTMWFSEMPFLTAVQIQESYAYTMNVNFIAAGANNVRVGSAGSGIYSGSDGALISVMPGEAKSHLLVTKVPKVPGKATFIWPGPIYDDPGVPDMLLLTKDLTVRSEVSRALQIGFQEFSLVDKDVSCRFRIKINKLTPEDNREVPKFRAFVKDGFNTYAQRKVGVVLCAVVACKNESIESCPYRYHEDEKYSVFSELEITMTSYPNQYNNTLGCDNVVYYPSSMRYNKFPLQTNDFVYRKSSQNSGDERRSNRRVNEAKTEPREQILYKLTSPSSDIASFAIWGRMYVRDVNSDMRVPDEDITNYIETENLIYSYTDIDKNKKDFLNN